jgi:hypothetical protein
MKIEIETKYNVRDIVIGYKPKYGFMKYEIVDIFVEQQSVKYTGNNVRYLCQMVGKGNLSCQDSFYESELLTVDDIYEQLGKVVTYPTTTEQAKHDINMYVGLKNFLWNPHAYLENTHTSDLIKWLESKFPEIEQYVKTNMK